jgi:DNA mismatch endonuclease (patch repair protein)
MIGNRSRDTKPEMQVRRIAHRMGLRYRVNARPIDGFRCTADLLFPRVRVAVFVDGCFWHNCPEHATKPSTNADYWLPKLQRNSDRDATNSAILRDKGWIVLRFWEHEDPFIAATLIRHAVDRRRAVSH